MARGKRQSGGRPHRTATETSSAAGLVVASGDVVHAAATAGFEGDSPVGKIRTQRVPTHGVEGAAPVVRETSGGAAAAATDRGIDEGFVTLPATSMVVDAKKMPGELVLVDVPAPPHETPAITTPVWDPTRVVPSIATAGGAELAGSSVAGRHPEAAATWWRQRGRSRTLRGRPWWRTAPLAPSMVKGLRRSQRQRAQRSSNCGSPLAGSSGSGVDSDGQ